MNEVAVAFAACSSTKAATTTVTPRRPGTGPASGAGRSRDGAGSAGARDCSVVAAPMLSRAIIAIVPSTARSPKAPMMKVAIGGPATQRSEEHTSELQSRGHLVCRLLLEKKKTPEH